VHINLAEELLAAARVLGCQPLQDVCLRLLGDFQSRIREYTFDQVKECAPASPSLQRWKSCEIVTCGISSGITLTGPFRDARRFLSTRL
jgi:hypothetical protein